MQVALLLVLLRVMTSEVLYFSRRTSKGEVILDSLRVRGGHSVNGNVPLHEMIKGVGAPVSAHHHCTDVYKHIHKNTSDHEVVRRGVIFNFIRWVGKMKHEYDDGGKDISDDN